jgi:hypothetical protein
MGSANTALLPLLHFCNILRETISYGRRDAAAGGSRVKRVLELHRTAILIKLKVSLLFSKRIIQK